MIIADSIFSDQMPNLATIFTGKIDLPLKKEINSIFLYMSTEDYITHRTP